MRGMREAQAAGRLEVSRGGGGRPGGEWATTQKPGCMIAFGRGGGEGSDGLSTSGSSPASLPGLNSRPMLTRPPSLSGPPPVAMGLILASDGGFLLAYPRYDSDAIIAEGWTLDHA